MLAVRFYGPGQLRVEDVPIPTAGSGELVVKTAIAVTCGTDVKMYRRGHPLTKPPQVIGHEFAGIVSEVGADVEKFRKGMRVVAANSAPCNSCFYCFMKQPNLCERLDDCLVGFTWPGAYAEYVRLPDRIVRQNTFIIPEGVSLESVASLEPLACVVHGWDLINFQSGGTVAIVGGGPIGLLHAQLARLHGAKLVMLCDPHTERLSEEAKSAIDVVVNSKQVYVQDKIGDLTHGRGVDLVIEAAGRKEAWESAHLLARKGGTVLLFGGCPSGTMASFDTARVHYGELHVQGAFHHTPSAVDRAFKLVASGRISTKPLITHEMRLKDAEEALQLMSAGRALKVALRAA
jgi:L-iditol 2-dehydrogenase